MCSYIHVFFALQRIYGCALSHVHLCDPMDCSLPGCSVHEIFQSTGVGCQSLLWGNLPDPEVEPLFLTSPVLAGSFFITSATWEAQRIYNFIQLLSTQR